MTKTFRSVRVLVLCGVFSLGNIVTSVALTPSNPQGGAWGGWSASSLSASGEYLASVSLRGEVALWSPQTGENLFLQRFPGVIFRSVLVTDALVVAGAEDGTLKAFTVHGTPLNFPSLPGTIRALAAGEKGFWSVCDDGNLRFQNWQGGIQWTMALKRSAPVLALTLSADGQWLAVSGEDGKLEVRSSLNGRLFASWQVAKDWVRTVVALPQGWLCGDDQGNLTWWGLWGDSQGKTALGEAITALTFAHNQWAAGSLLGTFWVGHFQKPSEESWPCSVGPVAGISAVKEGWISCGADGSLRLWKGDLGQIQGEILP